MAIKALALNTTVDFICEGDDDNPTIWKLAVLSSRDVGAIRDSVTTISFKTDKEEDGDINTNIARSKMNFEAVRRGLKGWENFIGPDDAPIQFQDHAREIDGKQRRVVKPELLDIIPLDVIQQMATAILDGNEVEDEDMGNSPAPSTGE